MQKRFLKLAAGAAALALTNSALAGVYSWGVLLGVYSW